MKNFTAISALITAFSLIMFSCTNYKPVKGDYYKDTADTIKKDSVKSGKRVDVRDSIQKY